MNTASPRTDMSAAASHAQAPSARAPFQEAATRAAPEAAKAFIGRFHVQNAVPMKGATPDKEGNCFFLLKCFPIPQDATPGKIRDMRFTDKDAEYHVYFGLICNAKGEKGMTVGYIYNCYGNDSLRPLNIAEGMGAQTVSETRFTMLPHPQVVYDTNAPCFGAFDDRIQSFDETIATEARIQAIRNPRPAMRARRPSVWA